MKQSKYDIARLHKDCLAWCENPQWKPWMVEEDLRVTFNGKVYAVTDKNDIDVVAIYSACQYNSNELASLTKFAHFIGLDVESYRLPQMTRDEAVRDYLDSIPEGATLWEGSEWIKVTDDVVGFCAKHVRTNLVTILETGKKCEFAYTFLRLDLHDKYRDAV